MHSPHRPFILPPLRRISALAALPLLLVFAWPSSAATPDDPPVGWWRGATFYEIFVRSFADAKTGPLANDGIGDLQGLIEHLDYLNDGRGSAGTSLGVNAVWLMPLQPSPSYHGYDVTDYFGVNPQFGDVDLMKKFVQEAHRRGIRVIIDLVLNHCSSAHPWFVQAAAGKGPEAASARKLFRFADVPEQLSGPWGQRVWHPANGVFYYAAFSPDMPDWNLREPKVTAHHHAVAEFWLKTVGVDGFRLDAVRYFVERGDETQDTEETRQWLREFTAYCHSVKPGAFVIGENTADMKEVARCIRGQSLDSAFEFDLEKAIMEAVRLRTPGILNQAMRQLEGLYGPESPWATIISNHDQDRALTQLGGDVAQARLATEVLFTLPGVPFVYYGEELGMSASKPDPELRTPMAWTPDRPNAGFTPADVAAWHPLIGDTTRLNVATEAEDPNSFLALYRRLIRLNAGSPALRHGRSVPVSGYDHHVYVAMRTTDEESVLILGNFDRAARACPTLDVGPSPVRNAWRLTEDLRAADVTPPTVGSDGAIARWSPLHELAPQALYVIRLRRP